MNYLEMQQHIILILLLFLLLLTTRLHAEKPKDWKEPNYIKTILSEAGDEAELPRGLSHCVAYEESRFIPTARSRVVGGFRSDGIMQLYRKYLYSKNGIDGMIVRYSDYTEAEFDWKDPKMNATVGCNYLAYLIKRFGGSVWLGILAYNYGMTNLANIRNLDDVPKECITYANNICKNLDNWDESW